MFLILALLLIVATVFDLQSTFAALDRNPYAYEKNVLLRWVVKIGAVPTYAFRMIVNAIVIWLCWKLKQPGTDWTTSIWWLPFVACSAFYLFIAWRNTKV